MKRPLAASAVLACGAIALAWAPFAPTAAGEAFTHAGRAPFWWQAPRLAGALNATEYTIRTLDVPAGVAFTMRQLALPRDRHFSLRTLPQETPQASSGKMSLPLVPPDAWQQRPQRRSTWPSHR